MNLKKVIPYVAFLGIGVFVFYQLIEAADYNEVVADMKSTSLLAIAITFTMGLLAVISRGLRWKYLLQPLGYKASNKNAVSAVAFGYLANTAVPRSGEVARCAALNSTDDIPVDKLLGTVITERVVDFIMLFIFLSIAIITNYDAFFRLLDKINISFDKGPNFVLILSVAVLLVGVFVIIKRRFSNKISKFLKGVGNGVKSVRYMEKKWAFIFHTLFIWTMYFLMSYSVFISMDKLVNLEMFEGLLVMVSGGFGMVFPAPAGIGSYQFAVKIGFEAIGRAGSIGVAAGNVVWFTQTLMLIIAGAIGYLVIIASRNAKSIRPNKGVAK